MVNLVKLHFDCIVECDYQYADELGSDIATDLLNGWDNGEDYLDWIYTGCDLMEFDYKERIRELEKENQELKEAMMRMMNDMMTK